MLLELDNMATYYCREGQNLFDVALQLYGDAQYMTQICFDNNLSLNTDLIGFQAITYDDTIFKQTNSTLYLALNNVSIVTNFTNNDGSDLIEHNIADYTAEEHN